MIERIATGIMNANITFMMIDLEWSSLTFQMIEINKILMNIILKISKNCATPLNVTTEQIQRKLAVAPLYTLAVFLGFYLLAFLIRTKLSWSVEREFFTVFIVISFVILLVYYVLAYVLIYASQLFLIKFYYLNLWFILLSAIALIPILTLILSLFLSFKLSMVGFIGILALAFSLMYWFLLFKQHQKNILKQTQ